MKTFVRNAIEWLLLCAVIVGVGYLQPAHAQGSGGFPSRPVFQSGVSRGLWAMGSCTVGGVSCATGTTPVSANPTALVGPTAVNGSGTAYMLANAAPAICSTCTYVMSGPWTFSSTLTGTLTGSASLDCLLTGCAYTGAVSITTPNSAALSLNTTSGNPIGLLISQSGVGSWNIYESASSSVLRFFDGTSDRIQFSLGGAASFAGNITANTSVIALGGGSCTWANSFAGFASCNGATPGYEILSMSGGTDAKGWDWYADSGGSMHWRLLNDANTIGNDYLILTRTGVSAVTVNYPALATLQVASSPVCSAANSSCAHFGDSGANFSGATPPTVAGSAICTANGTNCPSGASQTTGTFAFTYTSGCATGTSSASGNYSKSGNIVALRVTSTTLCTTQTSNVPIVYGGLPAALQPVGAVVVSASLTSTTLGTFGGDVPGLCNLTNSAAFTCAIGPFAATFFYGFPVGSIMSYTLN